MSPLIPLTVNHFRSQHDILRRSMIGVDGT
jgi:hypothetical protein